MVILKNNTITLVQHYHQELAVFEFVVMIIQAMKQIRALSHLEDTVLDTMVVLHSHHHSRHIMGHPYLHRHILNTIHNNLCILFVNVTKKVILVVAILLIMDIGVHFVQMVMIQTQV